MENTALDEKILLEVITNTITDYQERTRIGKGFFKYLLGNPQATIHLVRQGPIDTLMSYGVFFALGYQYAEALRILEKQEEQPKV